MEKQPLPFFSEPLTTEREWTVDGVPVLTASICLPNPSRRDTRAIRRIAWFYRAERRDYLRYCEIMLFPRAAEAYRQAAAAGTVLPRCHAELTCRVSFFQDDLWSLHTDTREQIGSSVEILRRGDTWNLRTGFPVPLSGFFPPRYPVRKTLLRTAGAEIERQERAGIAKYHETWRQDLRRTYSRENFYLSPDGICFFWQMHAIAPAAEGIPTFHLPFSENGCRLSPNRGGAPGL